MYSQLLPFCSFHLRRIRSSQPILLASLVITCSAFLVALPTWLALVEAGKEVQAEYDALKMRAEKNLPAVVIAPDQGEMLRPFNSAYMVTALNEAATRAGVALNELNFTFDAGKTEPFIRYRVSMTVATNYLAMRRFVDQVKTDIPDVSLDSISCRRKGIEDPVLTCDLGFTAFFKKDERG
jgi:hypothetical protein